MYLFGRIDGPPGRFRRPTSARVVSIAVSAAVFATFFLLPRLGAQELPEIQTDRPDATECPFIVPAGYIQWEGGFSYERPSAGEIAMFHPSSLARVGLTENLEFRLTVELTTVRHGDDVTTGLIPISAGWKIHIMEENGWLPQTAFIHHLTFPRLSSPAFRTSHITPSFRFAMQHTLSNESTLGYNVGAEWNDDDPDPTFLYTLSAGWSLFDRAGAFVEMIAFAPAHSAMAHTLAGGCTFLAAMNVQLDVSGGVGLSGDAPDFFVATGLSFRLIE